MELSQQVRDPAAEWVNVLAHREDPAVAAEVRQRFEEQGLGPGEVAAVLQDGGGRLFADAAADRPGWTVPYGGLLAVALLASEAAARSAFLLSRAAAVRAGAVDALLEDVSAVQVAAQLGISRQKVHEIGRAGAKWRRSLKGAER